MLVPRDAVAITGEVKYYEVTGESGHQIEEKLFRASAEAIALKYSRYPLDKPLLTLTCYRWAEIGILC
jgi:hypothetical protein